MKMIKKLQSSFFFDQIIGLERAHFGHDALTFTQLGEIIERRNEAIFLYCENETVLGYIYVSVLRLDNLIYVMKLVITEEYQNQGLGAKLIHYVEQFARYRGIHTVLLEVRQSNMSAVHLYKKLGYEELMTRKDFYQFPQEDGLVLRKNLSAVIHQSKGMND